MRRLDVERNDTGGRGFRIIEASGRYLEPLTPPPPPRAPEPYKVASTSSSLGRAHRRSSFVIIAETRPATPNSRSNSPAGSALASLSTTGRVSPFRGRGFRGPLPHAQSRSQSPDNRSKNGREYGRFDRRASVSQQNSPKRSLIPQPTRRRSVSLTKNIEIKKSPKFGRRAIPRKSVNSTITTNPGGNLSRRHSLKAPDLSPIQGTPTKPAETRNAPVRDGKFQNAKISPTKARNNLAVPKNPSSLRKPLVQEKSSSKETTKPRRFVEEKRKNVDDDATTKIPIRRGSIVNKNGAQTISTNRFVSKNPKSTVRSVKPKETENPEKTNENGVKENTESSVEVPGTRFIDIDVSSEPKKPENDLKLVELLKQSSGATGTSSVVNATTTTAVQPLQIDADRVKNQESTINKDSISAVSPASREISPSSKDHSPSLKSENSPLPRSPKPTNSNQDKKIDNREKNGAGSSTIGSNPNSTNQKKSRASPDESSGNSTKKEPSNGNGTTEKNIVTTSGSKKNLLTRSTVQETNRGEMRIPSANPGSRGSNGNPDNSKINDQAKSEKMENAKIEESSNIDVATSGNSKEENRNDAIITENEDSVDPEKNRSKNVANGKNVETTTKNNANVRSSSNGNDKVIANNGSENSLKSSNGLSTTSVESTRSTDTGVSVNTVRGVSSAREKKGMHMMKRSEEIETLSGNVMHLERNGEPAVLDIAEGPEEEPQDQTRLGRFKKSLTDFRERLPSMRWPGCRKNQKSHHPAWIEDHQNHFRGTQGTEHENPDDSTNPGSSRFHRMWSRLKNSCRCGRFRGCNCCRRAARVAPAESTSCCPPERRCGALCGRIFSRCKCKKNEVQHTRSIRAKHSLTSVAPPPLSEEHKSKIPEVLVEHNSVMRGAIPCLPVPIAWFCLVWNVLVPGTGTIWSGLFNLCVGQPRFAISASPRARFGALVVNLMVGVGQFFTVLFCLVGWGWSIWWGVTMIRLARKYKRFRASEAASNDLEARAGEPTGLPPGVPSQALRGMERAR